MALCVCDSACLRISIDLVEERRIVGKVEEPAKGVQRTRGAIEIVVIELSTKLATKFQPMIASHVAYHIAKLESSFPKRLRELFQTGARRSECDCRP